jgi:hypothetical protein
MGTNAIRPKQNKRKKCKCRKIINNGKKEK